MDKLIHLYFLKEPHSVFAFFQKSWQEQSVFSMFLYLLAEIWKVCEDGEAHPYSQIFSSNIKLLCLAYLFCSFPLAFSIRPRSLTSKRAACMCCVMVYGFRKICLLKHGTRISAKSYSYHLNYLCWWCFSMKEASVTHPDFGSPFTACWHMWFFEMQELKWRKNGKLWENLKRKTDIEVISIVSGQHITVVHLKNWRCQIFF